MKTTLSRSFSILGAAVGFLISVPLSAQFNCGTDDAVRELTHGDATYEARKQAYDDYIHNAIMQAKAQRNSNTPAPQTSVYTIPVVFHIIHEYGSEDISDAQVQDEVDILNEDYNKLNADTASVIPPFQPLIADVKIQFKLARIDPWGNCTNGIEHIYSHETRIGDDGSKLHRWPRDKYLNVWVVKSMQNGVAGYAYYPSAVDQGFGYMVDGVIILSSYIGSIGTSSPGTSRALTHEIGHYLSLAHLWGSTNSPGVACGDDNIPDTPTTKGWSSCPTPTAPLYMQWVVCSLTNTPPDTIIENVQNYMEYSYCSKMFTHDQAAAMTAALMGTQAERNNLWQPANLAATGTDGGTYPPCVPTPDFSVTSNFACEGSSLTYTDHSWNGTATSRQWTFYGGTPLNSSVVSPSVTYNNWGFYPTTLSETNASGTDTLQKWSYVFISPPWADYTGSYSEDFENNNFNQQWFVQNPENNASQWTLFNGAGYSGSKSIKLNTYGSDAGVIDNVISPSMDLSNTTSMTLNFKWSCATRTVIDTVKDVLKVYSSTDCGKTWTPRKTISGFSVVTAGYWGNPFTPTSQTHWQQASVVLPSGLQQPRVRFKFEYTAGAYSNNIYIDDINISGVVGMNEVVNNDFNLSVYPNPAENQFSVDYSLVKEQELAVTISDMLGQNAVEISKGMQSAGEHHISLDQSALQLPNGVYLLSLTSGTTHVTRKLILIGK